MENNRKQTLEQIAALFASQDLAVLSTQKNSQPYASLVAFAASPDLAHLYFLTPTTTRKYDHLTANPPVAILVNDSRNQADDIYRAVSVTGTGTAAVADKEKEKKALALFLQKHPHLKEFSKAPTTAFICVAMHRYYMVSRFQNVVELEITP
jgi:nitroimidazol reductase NimA-like FMN-containing flavoprotein (pyridoxamine 5'-phosphate oxidase superfamily)